MTSMMMFAITFIMTYRGAAAARSGSGAGSGATLAFADIPGSLSGRLSERFTGNRSAPGLRRLRAEAPALNENKTMKQ